MLINFVSVAVTMDWIYSSPTYYLPIPMFLLSLPYYGLSVVALSCSFYWCLISVIITLTVELNLYKMCIYLMSTHIWFIPFGRVSDTSYLFSDSAYFLALISVFIIPTSVILLLYKIYQLCTFLILFRYFDVLKGDPWTSYGNHW